VNTYARGVKAFFRWLKTEGIITVDPLSSEAAPKKPRTIPRVYSDSELRAFFEVAERDLRNKAVIFMFLDTGLRLTELSEVTVNTIDIREGSVRVMGKGRKEGLVHLSPPAAAAAEDYIKNGRPAPKNTDRLFLTPSGHLLSARGMQSMLARLGREAGVKERLSPHKLRHTLPPEA
jgi:site-specific recombinase XerD